MADKKISQLTAVATLTGTEIVPIVQSGVTVSTTAQDIADLAPAGATSLTYSELSTLISTNALNPGGKYLITDYVTTYKQPWSNVLMSGTTEPLLVTAQSVNELEVIAYSTLFPQDIIYYEHNNTYSLAMQSGVPIAYFPNATKGYIYRRIDTVLKNDICFDFRQVKFRRYKTNVGAWSAVTTYAVGDFAAGSDGKIYHSYRAANLNHSTLDGEWWINTGITNLSHVLTGSYYDPAGLLRDITSYTDYYIFQGDPMLSYNNTISRESFGDILVSCNIVCTGENFQNNTLINCDGLTFGNYTIYNNLNSVKNSIIGSGFNKNIVRQGVLNSILGVGCFENVFNYMQGAIIGLIIEFTLNGKMDDIKWSSVVRCTLDQNITQSRLSVLANAYGDARGLSYRTIVGVPIMSTDNTKLCFSGVGVRNGLMMMHMVDNIPQYITPIV